MSNWSSRTMPHFNEHSRSASVAGYQDFFRVDHEPPKYDQSWMYRTNGQHYSSSVDISKNKPDTNNYQRFTWRSPAQHPISNSVSSYSETTDYSQKQRPFETAFKSAITKMKESSLSRLGMMDKTVPTVNLPQSNINKESNEFYRRNCQTLQPTRTHQNNLYREETGRKIFRCEPSVSKGQINVYSVSPISKDIVSDTESDNTLKNDQSKTETNLSKDRNKKTSFSYKTNFTYSNYGKDSKPGASIVIPVKEVKAINSIPKEQSAIKTEAYISPSFCKPNKSSLPQIIRDIENDDDLNFESLPSVQEIISKVEALNNQSGANIMSKSLNITNEKPPILISQKSSSQRTLDNLSNSTSSESPIVAQKKMSGVYKKNVTNISKGKSISNMPSDFQKLHLAFLDQKQEIQRLRHELAEKNALITQLETDLRNYEPWR